MKLWQFLKRWRQAYLDDKGDRIHAQIQAEKEMMEYYRAHPEEIPVQGESEYTIINVVADAFYDNLNETGIVIK